MSEVVNEVFQTIRSRQRNPHPGSYTHQLLQAGEDEILKKIGEEATEVILAAKSQGPQRLLEELADLTYHCLVLLASRALSPSDVEEELRRRNRP